MVFSNQLATASAPVPIAKPLPAVPVTIQDKIEHYASKYNVSAEVMNNVINCESGYNPNAVGDNGNSFGLSQIYLPAHPYVTQSQAIDIDFSLEFMAKNIKSNPRMWTCYRMIYE